MRIAAYRLPEPAVGVGQQARHERLEEMGRQDLVGTHQGEERLPGDRRESMVEIAGLVPLAVSSPDHANAAMVRGREAIDAHTAFGIGTAIENIDPVIRIVLLDARAHRTPRSPGNGPGTLTHLLLNGGFWVG